ncbi:MAG: NAD(P)-dependent methylenetetrahydromethanopterin dehydrogenase [Methylococcales bacterium]
MVKRILYFLTPGTHVSAFDITIAADAGFDMVVPVTEIRPEGVANIVQDAIFSRPPRRFKDTCIFIGGRDVHMATDMFQKAKNAMVGDFQVGVFADPNGAYTTSASVVALVEQAMLKHHGRGVNGRKVAVFGTGPVGLCTASLLSKLGASTRLCHLTADDDRRVAIGFCERYKTKVEWVSGQTAEDKRAVLKDSEIVICAARAGVRILDKQELDCAENLLLAADTNAVPPSGITGVGPHFMCDELPYANGTFRAIGALAIGNLKYKTQFGLYEQIHQADKPALFDFTEAYEFALSVLHK